jgi:hypothetical protein
MKKLPLVEVIVVNAILISLLALITQNYALRMAYWGKPQDGFTPTMTRYPFFFITSAVKGSTHLPGLLSVDWQQVVLVVLILTDAVYLWSSIRSGRRRDVSQTPAAP